MISPKATADAFAVNFSKVGSNQASNSECQFQYVQTSICVQCNPDSIFMQNYIDMESERIAHEILFPWHTLLSGNE